MRLVLLLAALLPPAGAAAAGLEEENLKQLLQVKRIYVDRLTGGETAAQMRDMLMSSLEGAKLFIITENQERADAVMRGSAEDLVFNESYSSSESLSANARLGNTKTSSRSGNYLGLGVGESESARFSDRRHEAVAGVRLVNKDGDVIWSTTQESLGAKFRGASVDVAEKITLRLREDYLRARKLVSPPAPLQENRPLTESRPKETQPLARSGYPAAR